MKSATALVRWLKPEEGGRSRPFSGKRYSAPSQFEDGPQTTDLWSLVLDFDSPFDAKGCATAHVRFLVAGAPTHLLRRGARFSMFEGARKTAEGEILGKSA